MGLTIRSEEQRMPSSMTKHPALATGLTVAALAAGAVSAPAASAQTPDLNGAACTYQEGQYGPQIPVTGCVPVASPWIKLSWDGSGGWKLYCPPSAPYNWNAESDPRSAFGWQRTSSWVDSPTATFVQRDGRPGDPGYADYYTINWSTHTTHWRYAIGCSPQPEPGWGENPNPPQGRASGSTVSAARVAAASGQRPRALELTRETRLRPRRTVAIVRRCPAGSRVARARHAVGYYTSRAPKRTTDTVLAQRIGRRIVFRVRTGRHPAAKVTIQTTLTCAR
jgi:hypothetical protein